MKEHFTDDTIYSLPNKAWNTIISYIKGARRRFITKKVVSHSISLKRALMIVNEYIDYRNGVITTIPFSEREITRAIERIKLEIE